MEHCETAQASLSAFIDDELESTERLVTVDHLVGCETCRVFYREARALDDAILQLDLSSKLEPAPESIWRRIEQERGAARVPASRLAAATRWAPRVAAMLLLGFGIWIMVQLPLSPGVGGRDYVEVVIEGDRGRMSEERFVELAAELLQSDRRFHRKMLEVMELVVQSGRGGEGTLEGGLAVRTEDGGDRNERRRSVERGEIETIRGGDRS